MSGLEGSFFTGVGTDGASGAVAPSPQIVFGSGSGITSSPNFTFDTTPGNAQINGIGLSEWQGYLLFPQDASNNNQGFVALNFTNTGSSRKNFVSRIGYNPTVIASDHAFYMTTESYFVQAGVGQLEWYLEFFDAPHTFTARPLACVVILEGGTANDINVGIQSNRVSFDPPTLTYNLMTHSKSAFVLTGTDGTAPTFYEIRALNSSSAVLYLTLDGRSTVPRLQLRGNELTNGCYLDILNASGKTGNSFTITTGTVDVDYKFTIDASGSFSTAGYMEMIEITAPSAPASNFVRIYAQDNGAGKTQLMALFSSGAAQQIAIQP